MGEMEVMPEFAFAVTERLDGRPAMREALTVLFGIPGTGPTGVRASSQ
jgi:hypothetical protein